MVQPSTFHHPVTRDESCSRWLCDNCGVILGGFPGFGSHFGLAAVKISWVRMLQMQMQWRVGATRAKVNIGCGDEAWDVELGPCSRVVVIHRHS